MLYAHYRIKHCAEECVEHIQVALALLLRPKNTSKLRRSWNLAHWTLGRATLALAIANIFIGMYLSHLAYRHIIAQAVVLGGLFIIVMLKNDIEYLLVGCTPAEEEAKLRAAGVQGVLQQAFYICIHSYLTLMALLSPMYGSSLFQMCLSGLAAGWAC